MSILDTFRARMAGGQPKAPASGTPAAPTTDAAEGLTMEGLLKQLAEQRPALEQRFEPTALLKAADLRTARKIYPEAEARMTYEFLTALCDDAQFGGKVLFCQRNAAGELEEVEGTRVQQLEAKWAEAAPHSLADERVTALRQGRAKAYALPAGGGEGAHSPKSSATKDPDDTGVDMSMEEALSKTNDPTAQATLDRLRKEGKVTQGQDSDAVH